MKKGLLIGSLICLALTITSCGKVDKIKETKDLNNQKNNIEGEYLTEEEMEEINKNNENDLNENIKYKFAKVISRNETKIEVKLLETPKGYKDKGYNEDLNINKDSLKETEEIYNFDIIGVSTNLNEIDELEKGVILRIGFYESSNESTSIFEDGKVLSVDII